MSLTSDSGACSVSSSDVCGRDVWDPEEEEEGAEETEEDGDAEAEAAAAAAVAAAAIRAAELNGIEFVSDADAAAAADAACDHHQHHHHRRHNLHHRRQGGGSVGRPPTAASQAGGARQPGPRGGGGVGGSAGRAYSHHRERVRRERFIELYGKLHAAIPNLQACKRVTHRKILTETAVYLAGTIAQIKARRRVNKLRALLVQLEADTVYMRRLSGMPQGIERQHQQFSHHLHHHQQQHQQQYRKGVAATSEDATAAASLSSGCLLVG